MSRGRRMSRVNLGTLIDFNRDKGGGGTDEIERAEKIGK